MTENTKLLEKIKSQVGDLAEEFFWSINMPVIFANKNKIGEIVEILKKQMDFDMYLDLTAVDWLDQNQLARFELVQHFYSTKNFYKIRIKSWIDEQDLKAPSLINLFGSANYMERECHEMYGIEFVGNPDLRPILLYEGFKGYPLRKDYYKNHEQPLVTMRNPKSEFNRNVK